MKLPERDSYEEIFADFRWRIPDDFNIATAVCDDWAAREPDRIALIEWRAQGDGERWTYGEIRRAANRLAGGLRNLGTRAGDRVAIILPQCAQAALAHIAIYKNGAIAVPLARLFAPEALQYRLANAGVGSVITNREGLEKVRSIRDRLPELEHIIVTETAPGQDVVAFEELLAEGDDDFEPASTGPETPALIIFTSGTTGPPKGALHAHRVLAGHIPGVQVHHEFLPQPGDVGWTPADWAWAGGLLNVLLPCLQLGVPVVYGGLDRFDPELAFRLMADVRVTCAFIPPTALRLMKTVENPASRFDLHLRTIGSGGESLGQDTYDWAHRELGVTVNEFYGQTECNLVLSSFAARGVTKAGAIGRPVPGHRVALINDEGGICEPGERGQVAIARPDPVMFVEYWGDEAATKAKFAGDWMLTGDQCIVDEDGYFCFVGRDDDIINSAGYRVGPGEIEDHLVSHPAVKLAAAVGKPDPLKTEIVKAYVVLTDGMAPSPELLDEVRAHVKGRLAANIYPREIEVVDEIPLTTTGKVIRRVFRDKARAEAENA